MKRKAIQLSRQTLVVSLPSKWVKQYNIKKGQELDIDASGGRLVVSSDNQTNTGEVLDINHDAFGKLFHRYLFKAYQHGIDQVNVTFSNASVVLPLKEKLQELIGYEITAHGKHHCTIKDVSGQNYGEFHDSLNRLFLIIKNILTDSVGAIQTTDSQHLSILIKRDQDVNKFSNFCLRLLSKNSGQLKKNNTYFYVITTLERIGDELKSLFSDILNHSLFLSKDELIYLQDLLQLFDHCYRFTFNTNIKKALEVSDLYDELKLDNLKLGNTFVQSSSINHHLKTLTDRIVSLQEVQLRFIENI